jgi:hypothetical protein
VVPKLIRSRYSVIYNTNIFSLIKKIDDQKKKILTKLKNVKNEIMYVNRDINDNNVITDDDKARIKHLFKKKQKYINDILLLKSAYAVIDQMFCQEVKNVETIKADCCFRWSFVKPKELGYEEYKKKEKSGKNMQKVLLSPEKMNPFIEKIIFSFEDDAAEQNEESCKFMELQENRLNRNNFNRKSMHRKSLHRKSISNTNVIDNNNTDFVISVDDNENNHKLTSSI